MIADALSSRPIEAVYASPLSRTMRVAEAVAARHGLKANARPGLIEMSIGEADGLTFAEVRRRFPGLLERWVSAEGPETPMPGGESLADVQRRAWDAIQSLQALHADEEVCAVTHNFVILSILSTALGLELASFRRLRHAVGAISVLDLRPSGARVQRMNDVCHLAED
jgi:broad specificity phosphatase PhoE